MKVSNQAIKSKKSTKKKSDSGKSTDELERELQYTRESLQTTIEELETSNEELKSTNEELQSTNEELQTSKEELQSLNEESATFNNELQSRIDELSQTNDDMKNLLDSTDIATLFLDTRMRIRRFTPKSTRIIPLTGADFGRPIKHFAHKLQNIDLTHYGEEVLGALTTRELQVESSDDHYYLMRVRPYRTANHVIDGIVITFEENTDQIKFKQATQHQRELLDVMLDVGPDLIYLKDTNLTYKMVNRAFCKFINKEEIDVLGKTDLDLFPAKEAEQYQLHDLETLKSDKLETTEVEITGADGIQHFQVIKTPLKNKKGLVGSILFTARNAQNSRSE